MPLTHLASKKENLRHTYYIKSLMALFSGFASLTDFVNEPLLLVRHAVGYFGTRHC